MKRILFQSGLIVLLFPLMLPVPALAGNVDPVGDGHKYAWSEKAGWINFAPDHGPGVTVTGSGVSGYAWGGNVGWIRLDPGNCGGCGVVNDGSGNLSGYAWGERIGWISFSCTDRNTCDTVPYGVTVDPVTGVFSGYAWGGNIGWIRFDHARSAEYGIRSAWYDHCLDDPDKIDPGICGCGVADTDSDDDGTADCRDAFPLDPSEIADNDGDGIGDNADSDDDNDGMPDEWERANRLDPFVDDAGDDADDDGLSNLGEFLKGSDPHQITSGPGIPVLLAPADLAQSVSLSATLETGYAGTADPAAHGLTRWQAAADTAFSALVMDIESENCLNQLVVPTMVLVKESSYYWRARYIDNDGVGWMWSAVRRFATETEPFADDDGNGIPDNQQMPAGRALDLDNDGTPDDGQAGMMVVALPDGSGQISFKAGDNVQSIQGLMRIDPADISDTANRPDDLPLELYGFRCTLETPDRPAFVRAICSAPFTDKAAWYKYDTVNGWQDFGPGITFGADRLSVLIELTDGGNGDADGVANGIVVDPSGPASGTSAPYNPASGGNGSVEDVLGCFIHGLMP